MPKILTMKHTFQANHLHSPLNSHSSDRKVKFCTVNLDTNGSMVDFKIVSEAEKNVLS